MKNEETYDVVVVGGGLAGLIAAIRTARGGARVALFEKAGESGGLARTREQDGYRFNLGPHALYRHGALARSLRELGVAFSGHNAAAERFLYVAGDRTMPLPVGPARIITNPILSVGEKLELSRAFLSLSRGAGEKDLSAGEWLARRIRGVNARALLLTFFRLTTYAREVSDMDFAVLAAQIKLGARGVDYLDEGWVTLVRGLEQVARDSGVSFHYNKKVISVTESGPCLDDGTLIPARATVLALDVAGTRTVLAAPRTSSETSPDTRRFLADLDRLRPQKAACLDLAYRKDDATDMRALAGALDGTRFLYASIHSEFARLAPEGAELMHLVKYLAPAEWSSTRAETDSRSTTERELEELARRLRPGLLEPRRLERRRFLPHMTVTGSLRALDEPVPEAAEVPGFRRVFVCGEWVGRDALLADAAALSAERVAERVSRLLEESADRDADADVDVVGRVKAHTAA